MLDKTDGRVLAGDWTAERTKLLETRWSEGVSATLIANELGGVSRSAVIGKAHRCGFKQPATRAAFYAARPKRTPGWKPAQWRQPMSLDERRRRRREREELKRITKPHPLPEIRVHPGFLNLTFDQLQQGDCRYPIGDSPFLFCGRPTIERTSWCLHCLDVVSGKRRAA